MRSHAFLILRLEAGILRSSGARSFTQVLAKQNYIAVGTQNCVNGVKDQLGRGQGGRRDILWQGSKGVDKFMLLLHGGGVKKH